MRPADSPERVAWLMLWGAFTVFVALLIAVPWGIFVLLNSSEQNLRLTATLSGGTVLLRNGDNTTPQALVDVLSTRREHFAFETRPASQTALVFSLPYNGAVDLAEVQLYSDTEALVDLMRSPRFSFSSREPRIVLMLTRGRMRVDIPEHEPAARVTITTPHSEITLERSGSYSIEVSSRNTQVIVRTGIAEVSAQDESVVLGREERTTVGVGMPPGAIESGARNLITNGDFGGNLSDGWTVFKNRSSPEAAQGQVSLTTHEGRQAVHFARFDDNWAELGLRQELNQDIRDLQSLTMQVAVWLSNQSLYNCGALGSECPVMIRIDYTDVAGDRREWLQGFYYNIAPENLAGETPTRCVTCPAPSPEHQVVAQGRWFLFESEDLLALFRSAGLEPVEINTVTVYASGHEFESYVAELALLAQD